MSTRTAAVGEILINKFYNETITSVDDYHSGLIVDSLF
ncbi:hypothetical protein BC749_10754 [Flavobacterium araucananum]|nr:hypothetical protein BC749_10754 [Flavobacterium araucananum]